jgi:hypothetical protein
MEGMEEKNFDPEKLIKGWESLARPMSSEEVQNERNVIIEMLGCFPEEILAELAKIGEDKILDFFCQHCPPYVPNDLRIKIQKCFGDNHILFNTHLVMLIRELNALVKK